MFVHLQDYAISQLMKEETLYTRQGTYITRSSGASLLCDILEIPYTTSPRSSEIMTFTFDPLCETLMRMALYHSGQRSSIREIRCNPQWLTSIVNIIPYFQKHVHSGEEYLKTMVNNGQLHAEWVYPLDVRLHYDMVLSHPFMSVTHKERDSFMDFEFINYISFVDAYWWDFFKNTRYKKTLEQEENIIFSLLMCGVLPNETQRQHIHTLPLFTPQEHIDYVLMTLQAQHASLQESTSELSLHI